MLHNLTGKSLAPGPEDTITCEAKCKQHEVVSLRERLMSCIQDSESTTLPQR